MGGADRGSPADPWGPGRAGPGLLRAVDRIRRPPGREAPREEEGRARREGEERARPWWGWSVWEYLFGDPERERMRANSKRRQEERERAQAAMEADRAEQERVQREQVRERELQRETE